MNPYPQRSTVLRPKPLLITLAFLFITIPFGAYRMGLELFSDRKPQVLGDQSQNVDIRPVLPEASAAKATTYVSTGGVNEPGRGNAKQPFKTISYALSQATPGTRIEVQSGTYQEFITTFKNASLAQPIVLAANGRVLLKGDDKSGRIMELKHDYYIVEGFEFMGKDILLWMQDADHSVIRNNYFHHAQGECVRIKYQSTNNVITKNKIEDCGLKDFTRKGGGKNGEGIYIGTAPEQLTRNPTPETDNSDTNTISYNTFATRGNECVDIKEGSSNNLVEFNTCTGQKDKNSGGMDSRGSYNTFRYNHIYGNKGAGIRFGGDTKNDGIHNEAYGNKIENNEQVAIKVQRTPQGLICGNEANGNKQFSNTSAVKNLDCPFTLKPAGAK